MRFCRIVSACLLLLIVPVLLTEGGGNIQAQVASPAPAPASPTQPQKMLAVGELKIDAAAGSVPLLSPGPVANFRKSLITGLVKSRKFAVLDREFGDQVGAEKHPAEGDRSEAGRTNKLGEEATADYLATASVKRCSSAIEDRVMRISGRHLSMYKFALGIAVEVIDVASRRIVFADSFEESASGVVQAGGPGFDAWLYAAMARSADRASAGILEAIYPLKIAAFSNGGEVILNEGAGRVDVGDEFEVFMVGEVLKDPDTGVEIGKRETLSATIRVTRVLPKAAYATVILSGTVPFSPGAICRKRHPIAAPKQSDATQSLAQPMEPAVKAGRDF